MADLEKNNDYDDALSRHTAEYNLSVQMSNPQFHSQVEKGQELKKALEARHLSMIAIGGALGTGLLIGTGSALKAAGPGGVFVAYSVIGFVVFMVLSALGEVATFIPLADGFAGYLTRYVDEALGFACGYIYLIKYLLLPANQLVAGSLVMAYWVDEDRVNAGVWIAIFLVVITVVNVLGVRFFGEIEFWLSVLKVLTCIGLIILLLVIALGGGPTKHRYGFQFWRNPGAFNSYKDLARDIDIEGSKGRFVAFLSVLVTSIFAYTGSELVGITFAECARPRQAIPKAIKLTFYRILVFYILSVLLLGMCVSSNDTRLIGGSNATASPFVIAIQNAKISGLDHVINACILIFVLSAANSDLYICSRTVYGLAVAGYAPKFFAKTNRMGVPYYGILLGFLFCCLAFMTVTDSASQIFTYFVNVVSLTGLITWACILVLHMRFMKALKAQGIDRKTDLNYRSPFQPFGTYFAFGVTVFIILIKNYTVFLHGSGGFPYKTFITGYIVLPVFIIAFVGYKLIKKTKFLGVDEIDLHTHRDVIDAEEEKFRVQDEEDKAVRDAQGNPKDVKWFYEKVFGWIF